ncbi:MAG: [Lachnospiraceae bacterium]|nr:[FeFe] hydrogenase H-cluster maturation GTPase HydF [Lachnospiraceae bacterium]
MSLNSTPSADRIHISIFGDTNAGKSSLINAITGQNLAIVSDISGTTTDPVLKSMELLPLGPVTIIDTPGLDDDSILGKLRTEKTIQILNKTDIAVIVCDICVGFSKTNLEILIKILGKKIPFVIVGNKADLFDEETTKESFYSSVVKQISSNVLTSNSVSSINDIIFTFSTNIDSVNKLKERIASLLPEKLNKKPIVSDLINENDTVICVVPVDEAAPKGRLILPQQQTIRDIIDKNAYAFVTKDTTLSSALNTLNVKPKLVITDSQVFGTVSKIVPNDIPLTSFSILFARHKGDLKTLVEGASYINKLKNGSNILISEGCTHHRQCNDIGTVKLPNMLKKYTGAKLSFHFTSGTEFYNDLTHFDLIIHCGGCMLNDTEVKHRISQAVKLGVPITNYGTALALMNGILKRSLAPFKEIQDLLD